MFGEEVERKRQKMVPRSDEGELKWQSWYKQHCSETLVETPPPKLSSRPYVKADERWSDTRPLIGVQCTEKLSQHTLQNCDSLYSRKTIPQALRKALWETEIGTNYIGKCYVCGGRTTPFEFEAGHIISSSDGGEDTLRNLRVLCCLCNRSMGTQNLDEYKCQFYNK